jgi:hypothetical protein
LSQARAPAQSICFCLSATPTLSNRLVIRRDLVAATLRLDRIKSRSPDESSRRGLPWGEGFAILVIGKIDYLSNSPAALARCRFRFQTRSWLLICDAPTPAFRFATFGNLLNDCVADLWRVSQKSS